MTKIIPLSKGEKKSYPKQEICRVCKKKKFKTIMMEYYKVKDHCYFIGKYRGAPHNICNIRYKIPK